MCLKPPLWHICHKWGFIWRLRLGTARHLAGDCPTQNVTNCNTFKRSLDSLDAYGWGKCDKLDTTGQNWTLCKHYAGAGGTWLGVKALLP